MLGAVWIRLDKLFKAINSTQEHGVHKIYLLQTLRIETDITTTFYVIRPKIKNVRTLAGGTVVMDRQENRVDVNTHWARQQNKLEIRLPLDRICDITFYSFLNGQRRAFESWRSRACLVK